MNTHELEYLMLKLIGGNLFKGVYASDTLPILDSRKNIIPGFYIVNSDEHYKKGTHWMALTMENDNSATFFDSYGKSPRYYSKDILRFLELQENISYQTKTLQNMFSSVCGQHCMFYLLQRARGLSYKNVLKLYCDDVDKNDTMVANYVKRYKSCISMKKNIHGITQHACSFYS